MLQSPSRGSALGKTIAPLVDNAFVGSLYFLGHNQLYIASACTAASLLSESSEATAILAEGVLAKSGLAQLGNLRNARSSQESPLKQTVLMKGNTSSDQVGYSFLEQATRLL